MASISNPASEFLKLVRSGAISDYDDRGAKRKNRFHELGREILEQLAHELGLLEHEFSVRSNRGGIAVCGEVTLHAEWVYVQLSQTMPGLEVMYRSCKNRQDYQGGRNQWLRYAELEDLPAVAAKIKRNVGHA